MRREIKFRLWDKELGMEYNPILGPIKKMSLNFLLANVDDVLMQYTGINDIAGKEIYEGDIVEPQYGGRYIVKFGEFDNHQEWEDNVSGNGWYLDDLKWNGLSHLYSDKELKVIGNIYENPELLEVKP